MTATRVRGDREDEQPFGRPGRLVILAILASVGLGLAAAILLLAERRHHDAFDTVAGRLVETLIDRRLHRLAWEVQLLAAGPAAGQGVAGLSVVLVEGDGGLLRALPGDTGESWRPGADAAALQAEAARGDGPASGFVAGPGGPALGAVARAGREGHGFVLLLDPLDGPLLDRLAQETGLEGLRLAQAPKEGAPRTAPLQLAGRDGTVLGALVWNGSTGSTRMLDWVLPVLAADGLLLVLLCLVALNQYRQARSRISAAERRANLDVLTGLGNRAFLRQHLAARLARRGGGLALLYIDLDGFKQVNDSRGHVAGDRLLAALGRRLRLALSPEDAIARVGGDEFIVVQRAAGQPGSALLLCRRLLNRLSEPFAEQGEPLQISASIGVAVARPGETAEALVERADKALYRAKAAGPASYCLSGSEPARLDRPASEHTAPPSAAAG